MKPGGSGVRVGVGEAGMEAGYRCVGVCVCVGGGEEGDGIMGGVGVAGSRPDPFTFGIKSRIIMLSVLQRSGAV